MNYDFNGDKKKGHSLFIKSFMVRIEHEIYISYNSGINDYVI